MNEINDFIKNFGKVAVSVNNKLRTIDENVGKVAISVKKWLDAIDWKDIAAKIDFLSNQYPKEYEKLVLSLMDRGWLIWVGENDSFTALDELFSCLVGKDDRGQDEYMKQVTKNNQKATLNLLLSNHPLRIQQIKDSFDAHENKLYYASIPAFVALSDGICRDSFPGIGLFAKYKPPKSGPKTKDLLAGIFFGDIFDEINLQPLKVTSKITKSINAPSALEEQSFNRHLIMHGISKGYGTEINSYKVISLLNYVSNAMRFLKDPKNKGSTP